MPNTSNLGPLLALAIVAAIGCRSATAVDPPKPADLLTVYKELGLPLPPAKAKLVRYEAGGGNYVDGELQPIIYSLAFELQPGTKKDGPLLLEGEREWRPGRAPKTEEVKPTAAAVEGVELDTDERASFGLRMEMLHDLTWRDVQGRRADRLRLLLAHLDDTEVRDRKDDKRFGVLGAGSSYDRITAGNAVAEDLGSMVGVEVPTKWDRTADEWAEVREKVRKAVKAELDKAK